MLLWSFCWNPSLGKNKDGRGEHHLQIFGGSLKALIGHFQIHLAWTTPKGLKKASTQLAQICWWIEGPSIATIVLLRIGGGTKSYKNVGMVETL